jgi:LuxR family transcriptional regulator, quorum-sensing system regulator SolR
VAPLLWSEDVFSDSMELWEEAHSYGLAEGWARPSRDGRGIMSLLTVARSAEPLTVEELKQKSHALEWLCQIGHIGLAEVMVPRYMPEALVPLTSRELTVLRWSAEGKTSEEVGEIMNIGHRTVNFHLGNAVAKLGASNKTSAAVRAAVLGLLH